MFVISSQNLRVPYLQMNIWVQINQILHINLLSFFSIFRKKIIPSFFIDCNQGTYGLGCKQTCGNCMNNETCFYINGSCLAGCDPGYEGEKCNIGMLIHFCPYDLVLKKKISVALKGIYLIDAWTHRFIIQFHQSLKQKRLENMNGPTDFRCKHTYLNKPFMKEHHETFPQLWLRKTIFQD